MSESRNVAVLGSTGSIGQNALELIDELPGFSLFGITGHTRAELLARQAARFHPQQVVLSGAEFDPTSADFPHSIDLVCDAAGIEKLATAPETDIVVAAIVGRAGLESTLAAVDAGKRVALANKEALVVAGQQIMRRAADRDAEVIPVDSEHSALFQCLQAGKPDEVERLVLTASGGPFRDLDHEQLQRVTVEQALDHPTWDMGDKITIDSATMMNKALEIIEARWLFDIEPDRISVVIHPQSIVHSLVEFCDGSVVSQLGPPDMKLPIQYALTWPNRVCGPAPRLDLANQMSLEFSPPDLDRFPALHLGYEVAGKGGTTGVVLNAANEAAVAAFLAREISFVDIVASCREVLNNHNFEPDPSMATLLSLDIWARKEISRWIAC